MLSLPTKIRIADFFAGIGGGSRGFSKKLFQVVYANDNDKYCKISYDTNNETKLDLKNIHTIESNTISDFDLFIGGFPCQPFSIAGQQKGFSDPRSNVFDKIVEILEIKKPRYFVLENVKNLYQHDEGKTFKTILNKLNKIGYFTKHKLINSYEYTESYQNRQRVFIIGFKYFDDKYLYKFPEKKYDISYDEVNTINVQDIFENLNQKKSEKYYINDKTYPTIYEKIKDQITDNRYIYQYRRGLVRTYKYNIPTLTAHMGTGGHNVPLLIDDFGIRKLTPSECLQIQGFNNFVIPEKMADCHLYKQVGNAIDAQVSALISQSFENLFELQSQCLTRENVYKLFLKYKQDQQYIKNLNQSLTKKLRHKNFPEEISENLVKYYFINYENKKCINAHYGDLELIDNENDENDENNTKKIEVKAFIGNAPSSFGSSEKWDILCFLDCVDYENEIVKMYIINLPNTHPTIQNFMVNKTQSFGQQCQQNRRPRFKFSTFKQQNSDDCIEVFNGKIQKLLFK